MIAFRVDANKYTATGHAMRCISIADALISLNEEVVFIVADDDSHSFVASKGFNTITLHTNWKDCDSEFPLLLPILKKLNPSWLVISSYQVTPVYLAKLNSCVRTMFIDDLDIQTYPVSAILNYNIYAERMDYRSRYDGKDTKLLLGVQYTPLRKQFQHVKTSISNDVQNILVTTGGTDPYGMAQRFLDCAAKSVELKNITFHMVFGAFAKDIVVPPSMVEYVRIHRNVSDMASLMQQCDLAITAGGSTNYELCACGIPSVTYSLSDDQLPGTDEFDRLGLIPYCGDIRQDIDATVQCILERLVALMADVSLRRSISRRMQESVDGQGAIRLAKELVNTLEEVN